MKSSVASNYRFRFLFNVVCLVLVMPHPDAGIEHVYALVNKNKAEGTKEIGWILKGFCLQSLQSSLLGQKFFSSATTLNLIKSFCIMLKKQQESIARCTLQFLHISQHCYKYYFLKLYTN